MKSVVRRKNSVSGDSYFIQNMDPVPKSRTDMQAAIFAGCAATPQAELHSAIDSFYSRCNMCLQCGGDRFEYKLD